MRSEQAWVGRGVLIGLSWLAMACGGSGAAGDTETCPEQGCVEASTGDVSVGSTGDDAAQTEGSSGGESTPDAIPCEVASLLAEHCGQCHGDPAAFGAPMSLTTPEDFRVPAITDPTRSVGELAMARMRDADRPMPPSGLLSEADQAVVSDWIEAGTPPHERADCEIDDEPDPVGPEALPCEPTAEFRAFEDGTDGEPFAVPNVDDVYMCFVFDNPFGATTQGTAWAPLIDDSRVVHHWLLLKTDNPDYEAGQAFVCGQGITLETSMLMGWAPGTNNFVMPEEAGLELPSADEKLILQIHYNNTAGYDDALDRSGVTLCTTEEPREHAASTLWLGTTQIEIPAGGEATTMGECDTGVRASEPFEMLLSWPHMHEHGESIRTEIVRQGSDTPETLVEIPQWNFQNQVYYPYEPSITVTPGDVLRTTCSYTNETDHDVSFGEGTGDEMCFDFALVYPITAFDRENPFGPPELGRYCVGLGGGGLPGGG